MFTEHPFLPLIIVATLLTTIGVFFMACSLILLKKRQNRQSKRYLESLLEEKENTMYVLSTEIHDNINQMLHIAAIHMHLVEDGTNPETRPLAKEVSEILKRLSFDTQNISHSLNPGYVKNNGFVNSLMDESRWLNATNRIRCDVNIEGERKRLPDQTGLMSFRIAQEALQNIIKYANADTVGIHLRFGETDFEMKIMDNGKGIDTNAESFKKGVGMESLHQRAAIVNGTLNIFSVPDNGTSVVLHIPNAFAPIVPVIAEE